MNNTRVYIYIYKLYSFKLHSFSINKIKKILFNKTKERTKETRRMNKKDLEINVSQIIENYIRINSFNSDNNIQLFNKQKDDLSNKMKTKSEHKFEYDYFLTVLKQKQSDSEFILNILNQLIKLVDRLEPSLFESNLIKTLINDIKWHIWYHSNNEILALFAHFLIDLNTAYASYIPNCLRMIIKMFTITTTTTSINIQVQIKL
jgi:hypothetical protein